MENDQMHRGKHIVLSFAAAMAGILFVALTVYVAVMTQNQMKQGQFIGRDVEAGNTISVSGTGDIYAKPDLAVGTFSVVSEAKTVAEAMADNTTKMSSVVEAVKELGAADKDLQTTNFSVYPRYEYQKVDGPDAAIYPNGKSVLVGYGVNSSLQVKMRDMEKIGQIIEGATKAGANEVGDLQFTIDKQDDLKKQARDQAIGQAKAKAEDLASQLGVRLVRIANFNENSYLPYVSYAKDMAVGAGGMAAPAPSIQTGENKVESTVNITYIIE
jgi:uncharacterized protein